MARSIRAWATTHPRRSAQSAPRRRHTVFVPAISRSTTRRFAAPHVDSIGSGAEMRGRTYENLGKEAQLGDEVWTTCTAGPDADDPARAVALDGSRWR
jgi:hypothetical protein